MYVTHLPAQSAVYEGGKEEEEEKKNTIKVQAVGSNDMVFITLASNWYWQ